VAGLPVSVQITHPGAVIEESATVPGSREGHA